MNPIISNGNVVTFSPVILNAGDSFEAKALLLVKNGETPTIMPTGKIAGVTHLQLSEQFRETSNETIFHDAFRGNIRLQIIRTISYSLIGMISIIVIGVLIIIPSIFISEKFSKIARVKKVKKYRVAANRRLLLEEEFLIAKYIDDSSVFDVFASLIDSGGSQSTHELPVDLYPSIHLKDMVENAYEELENAGLIVRDGPQVLVNPNIAQQAKEFVNFVEIKIKEKQVS